MGDEKNRHALLAQGVHDAEEPLYLMGREGCRRLVHDQHAHVEGDGLGDLDGLLFGEGQAAGRLGDVEPHVEPGQDLTRLAFHAPPVDDLAAVTVTNEDVLGHRQVRENHRFLVDSRDAEALRVLGGGDADRRAIDADLAAVLVLDAGHDLDQGRFAGPVLAQQRVDLATSKLEGDIVERQRGPELLRDVLHLEDGAFITRRHDCFIERPLDGGLNHPVRFP